MKPDLLLIVDVTARMLARFEDEFTVHRLPKSGGRQRMLEEVGPTVQAVATDGYYGVPADVMAAVPNLKICLLYTSDAADE